MVNWGSQGNLNLKEKFYKTAKFYGVWRWWKQILRFLTNGQGLRDFRRTYHVPLKRKEQRENFWLVECGTKKHFGAKIIKFILWLQFLIYK